MTAKMLNNKMVAARVFAVLLCAFMCLPVLLGIAKIDVAAADGLEVSLSWEGATLDSGCALPVGDRYAVVTAAGSSDMSTTVLVESFDISASASRGEYAKIHESITLKGGETYRISVGIGQQKNPDNTAESGAVSKIGDRYYTKQFGIKIASVTNNAKVTGSYLRAYIGYDANKGLELSSNSSLSSYLSGDYMSGGYSYTGAATSNTVRVDHTGEGNTSYTLNGYSSTYVDFHPQWSFSAQTSLVNTHISTAKTYYTVGFSWDDNTKKASWGGAIELWENGKYVYRNGVYDKNTTSNKSYHEDYYWQDTPIPLFESGYMNYTDSDKLDNTRYVSRPRSTFAYNDGYVHNYQRYQELTDFNYVRMWMSNTDKNKEKEYYWIHYSAILIDDTRPAIVDMSIDTSNTYGYKEGDDIFLAIRFSKPVQAYNAAAEGFGVNATLSSGPNTPSTNLDFMYHSGNLTDTLVFKATVPARSTSAYGTQIQINKFINTVYGANYNGTKEYGRVADLMLNFNCTNNQADLSFKNVATTFFINVDNRAPGVSIEEPTSLTKKTHSANVQINGVMTGSKAKYAWSTESDVTKVVEADWTTMASFTLGEPGNTVNPTGTYSGARYLHVQVTNTSGVTTYRTSGPWLFDNTPPNISTSVSGTQYYLYKKEHTVRVKINDPSNLSAITKVYIQIYRKEGNNSSFVSRHEVYESGKLKSVGDNLYEMTLSYTDVGLGEEEYGRYIIGFSVLDSTGNESPVIYQTSNLYFDSRAAFEVSITGENGKVPTVTIDGTDIYTNNGAFSMYISELGEGAGERDSYSVEQIMVDTRSVYTSVEGWVDGTDYADYGFASDPTSSANVGNADNRLSATVSFSDSANAYYQIVYKHDASGKQSKVVSFYVSLPEEQVTPHNYSSIYSEERLLINKVWQLATKDYYNRGAATPYDTNTNESAMVPIFSSQEKAYEYALFREYQDVEVIHLYEGGKVNGVSSEAIIAALNAGGSEEYTKASDAEPRADYNQVWLRYKSASWEIYKGQTVSQWVYYYYGTATKDESVSISVDALSDKSIGASLRLNATKISNGGWTYLAVPNGQADLTGPKYSRTAVFYSPETYDAADSIYSTAIEYSGDSNIYSSFVTYPLPTESEGTAEARLPLIASYEFFMDYASYSHSYIRAYNSGINEEAWLPIANGQNLTDVVSSTGVYEIAEIGGGYRTYLIYCDLDAPLIYYDYERSSSEAGKGSWYFDHSDIYSAKTLTLKHFITPSKPTSMGGLQLERDEYAYAYITREGVSIGSEYSKLLMAEDLENGFTFERGSFVLSLYDRLGNTFSVTVKTNADDIIEREPLINPSRGITFYFNRTEAEIAEFEITRYSDYLPTETDTVFAEEKTYVQSGKYTVYVKDIYGNEVRLTNVEFNREPPNVQMWYKNSMGTYSKLTEAGASGSVNASAVYEYLGNNTYHISSMCDIRLIYDLGIGYEYKLTDPDSATIITSDTLTETRLDIPMTTAGWTLTISHKNDPGSALTLTCVNDKEAPVLSADGIARQYSYNEELDNRAIGNNVLFIPEVEEKTVRIKSGQRFNGKSVTLSWYDETRVLAAYYTLDGGEPVVIDVNGEDNSHTVDKPGKYVFTAMDMLGNTSSFEVELSSSLNFEITSGGEKISYAEDPEKHIKIDYDEYLDDSGGTPTLKRDWHTETATYDLTEYAGKGFDIKMLEDMIMTFAYKNTQGTAIYQIKYEGTALSFRMLVEESEGGAQDESFAKDVTLTDGAVGDLFTSSLFSISYGYKDSALTLSVTPPTSELETFQIRLTDTMSRNPVIIQLERSSKKPTLALVNAEDNERVNADDRDFTGINKVLTLLGSKVDIVSAKAFRSDVWTTDFTGVPAEEVYDLMSSDGWLKLERSGYYKVIITNKYGNEQVMLVRISFGSSVDVLIEYEDFDARGYTLVNEGEFEFFTNKQFTAQIWDVTARVSVTLNGGYYDAYTVEKNGYRELMLKDARGEYVIEVVDDCGNKFIISLSLRDPETLEYGDYLTGFNQEAVRHEDNYTNAPLSLDRAAMETSGIMYAAYKRHGENAVTVLYDMISAKKIGYSEEGFSKSIGVDNGVYDVIFTDVHGNKHIETVYISDVAQLEIERQTQTATGTESITLSSAEELGAWTNFVIRLKNSAQRYLLRIDGVTVSFDASGRYEWLLSPSVGEGDEMHTVYYVDEYGNSYSFNIHLFRKVPNIYATIDGEEIIHEGIVYVKGNISYSWSDPTVVAQYSVGNSTPRPYTKDRIINTDGSYALTFTDIAGNVASANITRDTVVAYAIVVDGMQVDSGISFTGSMYISEMGEHLTVLELLRDGVKVEGDVSQLLMYSEHGCYRMLLSDPIGNTTEVCFDVFNKPQRTFTYTAHAGYSISQIWFHAGSQRVPYVSGVVMDEDGHHQYSFAADGKYTVELYCPNTDTYHSFSVEIDNVPPEAVLEGIDLGADNPTTRSDITFKNLKGGDTVEVYRDGNLVNTYAIGETEMAGDVVISKAGNYRVVIRDKAGNEVEYSFEREFTTNAASNVAICLTMLVTSLGGAIFIRARGRVRTK